MSKKQKSEAASPTGMEDLQQLVERARKGDRSVLPQLREYLDENSQVWQTVGDMAKHAEGTWIKLIAKDDLLVHESIRRELDRRRQELAGEDPTPLEKQLVDRIVVCWLALTHAEMMAASTAEHTLQQREHYLKRLDAAERRHQTAISQLSKVRELLPRKRRPVAKEVVDPKKPARQNGHAKPAPAANGKVHNNRLSVLFGERELVGSSEN
ncbi:MAG: hypothetical protein H6822_19675 [Planctomycetaceae bacterium]|nr:hypothetical protein [Planctomycetaceae bacterium]